MAHDRFLSNRLTEALDDAKDWAAELVDQRDELVDDLERAEERIRALEAEVEDLGHQLELERMGAP